jgi:tRNA pseudouridine32 synthase/23S rRNA pseudouridine746 synthase
MAAVGHPILGDALYAPAEVQAMAPRLLLHASHLAFAHPTTGEMTAFDWQLAL